MRVLHKWLKTAASLLAAGLLTGLLLPAQTGQIAMAADDEAAFGTCTALLRACDGSGNSNVETSFGNFMADAMRWFGAADVALLPSGDLGNHLQIGPVRAQDLESCLLRNGMLARTEMCAAQLYAYLEHGISHLTLNADETVDWAVSAFDGYLQLSGLTVVYDAAAPVGERVMELRLEDGTALFREDGDTRLSVVSTQELLDGGYGYPAAAEMELLDNQRVCAAAYVRHLGEVPPPAGGARAKICGTRDFWAKNGRMLGALIAVFGLLLVVCTAGARKRKGLTPRHYGGHAL